MRGDEILNDPLLNRGTAFTRKERAELGIEGFVPFHVSTIEEQVERRYSNFCQQQTDLAKFNFLQSLQNRNEILFYRVVLEHVSEMLPFIYTPTVGNVSKSFSLTYAEHRGIYLSYPLKNRIEAIINHIPKDEIDVIVVTDGERILGLGDMGVGGMAIPLGKLALYTLFGGLHPSRTLPLFLDVGTNNETLLQDPLYLGWRHKRITGEEYDNFVESVIHAIKNRYPQVLLQWEDFAKPHAYSLLETYRTNICSFNDDIQGTASVVLAGLLSAIKATGGRLGDQRIAVFGAGSAGLGICRVLVKMMQREGLTEKAAKERFYLVDRYGLIHAGLNEVDEAQKAFARSREDIASWRAVHPTLLDVVRHVHPTILIGVSAQPGAFGEEIVTTMAKHVKRPIIFPLSNPNEKCEAQPEEIIRWTGGKAIIATGSPFPPAIYRDRAVFVPQCNNVYIYPGVGVGVVASKATEVTDEMFLEAAQVLSTHSPLLKNKEGVLFPAFEDLRNISREIAIAVATSAVQAGLSSLKLSEIEAKVDATIWYPTY